MPMFVIITVDDLGLHPAVRKGVQHLLQRGRITSASLLSNGPDAENCLDIDGLGIGVQLNVLQGKPLSPQEDVSTMLRHDGCFVGDYEVMLSRFLDGKIQLGQIETEWSAQIEFVLDHSIQPTHLTAHRSMLAWPGLMNVAGKLAQRYGITWIRRPLPCERLLREAPGNRFGFVNVCTMLQKLSDALRVPDLVWGKDQEEGDGMPLNFLNTMLHAEHDVVEIVGLAALSETGEAEIHKSFVPGPTRAMWASSMAAMDSDQWRMVWDELDVTLVHYGQLPIDATSYRTLES